MNNRFSFRWGIPVLDNLEFTVLYHFLLTSYAQLGMTPLEMMFIIHLSQYRHECPDGQAAPSLATIAKLMGYTTEQRARAHKQTLIKKGLLRCTSRAGHPDVYDVAPFARAAWKLWQAQHTEPAEGATPTPIEKYTPIGNYTPIQNHTPTPIENYTPPLYNSIPEKENKREVKSRGVPLNETTIPDGLITMLLKDERFRAWLTVNVPGVADSTIRRELAKFEAWAESKQQRYKDWTAAARKWLLGVNDWPRTAVAAPRPVPSSTIPIDDGAARRRAQRQQTQTAPPPEEASEI